MNQTIKEIHQNYYTLITICHIPSQPEYCFLSLVFYHKTQNTISLQFWLFVQGLCLCSPVWPMEIPLIPSLHIHRKVLPLLQCKVHNVHSLHFTVYWEKSSLSLDMHLHLRSFLTFLLYGSRNWVICYPLFSYTKRLCDFRVHMHWFALLFLSFDWQKSLPHTIYPKWWWLVICHINQQRK